MATDRAGRPVTLPMEADGPEAPAGRTCPTRRAPRPGPPPVDAVGRASGATAPIRLSGGIVAYNEELGIAGAIGSLLGQRLPQGVTWDRVWVVASGCEDRTVERARAIAQADPRLEVVVETDRGGKARALRQVFRRAEGDLLVLLNADARAAPDAVAEMIRAARGRRPPFAVMARPVVPGRPETRWDRVVQLMWAIHHELHRELLAVGRGTHLADELLLLSRLDVAPIPEGVINDGAYLGAWLHRAGGSLLYAPAARVEIEVPRSLTDHLLQRRRIHTGHRQVQALLGVAPTTMYELARHDPRRALRLLRRAVPPDLDGAIGLTGLGMAEAAAALLSLWDRGPGGRYDAVRWRRIRPAAAHRTAPATDRIDSRRTAADPEG